MPWIEDLKYAEYWRKLSPKTIYNRDNSGNRPVLIRTSVSGEQPSTSHHDVQSQPTSQSCLCMYYKVQV
jgi:hypothetical protein